MLYFWGMKDQATTTLFDPGKNKCWATGYQNAAFTPSDSIARKKKLVSIIYKLPNGEKRTYTGYYTGKRVDATEMYKQEYNAAMPDGTTVEIREAA